MLTIDGSQGEGGGQILRTSLSLSALTGRPFLLKNIRAGRRRPGLRPQHLTAVQAAAAICRARLQGAEIGSTLLEFSPTTPPVAGSYRFDVAANAPHGSAGSVMLVTQTVLWPLLFAGGRSQVSILGGTHVPFSPSFHYFQHVTRQTYGRLGLQMSLDLKEWGWMPAGGGQVDLEIEPLSGLTPVVLRPAPIEAVHGLAVATNLPAHIPHRMARRADNLLEQAGIRPVVDAQRLSSHSTGAGLFLWLPDGRGGASALGRQGLPAQDVAENGVKEMLTFIHGEGAVDTHLADQLLLPMALAAGTSSFTSAAWSSHAITNAALLRQWLGVEILVNRRPGEPVEVIVKGTG